MTRRYVFLGYSEGLFRQPLFERPQFPSDGEIRCFIGVVAGLRKRGALSDSRAREYLRILHGRDPVACKPIIADCKVKLQKSPSPYRRKRVRTYRQRYVRIPRLDSQGYDRDSSPLRTWDPRTGEQLSGPIW